VASALQDHLAIRLKVNPDIGPIQLFFDDQRVVGNEPQRFFFAQVFVVVRPLGAKQVRSPGVFDELIA
jgi:hypothetical protein